MHRKPRLAAACSCVVAAAGVALLPATSSASSAQPTIETPTAAQTATLSAAAKALLTSNQAKTIVMDPTTGDILSVTAVGSGGVTPDIKNHAICNTGDGCFFTNRDPYADEGFYGGSGTYNGSWPYRAGYSSGKWTVSACWTSRCGIEIGPNTSVNFTSDVTGTSFTIH